MATRLQFVSRKLDLRWPRRMEFVLLTRPDMLVMFGRRRRRPEPSCAELSHERITGSACSD